MFEKYDWLHQDFAGLAARATQSTLHHSLLLYGSAGLGKAEFAAALAHYLLCAQPAEQRACGACQSCLLYQAETHPDLHIVESEKQIGVDLIRQSLEKLTSKSHISDKRVLLMFAADSMTEAASNALLKTLEEPLPGAYLILVTASPNKLLPTILSRCEKIQLTPPSAAQTHRFLTGQDMQASEQMIRMYADSPLLLLQQLKQDTDIAYSDFEDLLHALRQANADVTAMAKTWEAHTVNLFHWQQHWLRNRLVSNYEDGLMQLFQHTLAAQQSCSQAGINKVAQISGLFSLMQAYFVHGEISVC